MADQDSQPDPLAKRCGNCQHTLEADAKHVACFGVPPTPVLVGTRPAPLGRGMQMQFENMRPILSKDEPPCSLHKLRIQLDLSNFAPKGNG